MTEQEIISALRRKDEAAFKMLVDEYAGRVTNTALGFLKNREEAEDVAQEVFIEVYHAITSFRGDSRLSTWIYKITVRKSLDAIKMKNRKKRKGFIIRLFQGEEDHPETDIPHFDHPGVALENKELAAILFQAIESLPEQQKIAFTLSKIEGLSQLEIAAVMNTTESAVESLLVRAKSNLRKKLMNENN